MVSIVKNNFRIFNAENFIESFSETSPDIVYAYIGKVSEWTNELSPPSPTDKRVDEVVEWADMMGVKRVISSNVSHVIPRYDWTNGTVYAEYDSNVDDIYVANPPFFVVTGEYKVFKCISNNGGIASTIEPTGTSTSDIITADGYVWKFMFDISSSQLLKFFTTDWMPVPTGGSRTANHLAVVSNATDGAIHHAVMVIGGSGYVSVPTVTITGDGAGATATATISSGEVTKITVTSQGSGYTYATVTISGGSGTGATSRAIISPVGGHGNNAVDELGAFYVMCSVDLEQDEDGNFPTTNDFRKLGLIKNPNLFSDSSVAVANVYDQRTHITFASGSVTGDFEEDEWVYQGASLSAATAKGRVVSWDSSTNVLTVINISRETGSSVFPHFQSNLDIIGDSSGSTADCSTDNCSIVDPDLEPNSGKIIYSEHRKAIPRSSDQTENIRIVIHF